MQVSRLSRWQYIGILLSVVWAFGSTLYLYQRTVRARRTGQLLDASSLHPQGAEGRGPEAFIPTEAFAKCRKEAQHTRDALMEGKWVTHCPHSVCASNRMAPGLRAHCLRAL